MGRTDLADHAADRDTAGQPVDPAVHAAGDQPANQPAAHDATDHPHRSSQVFHGENCLAPTQHGLQLVTTVDPAKQTKTGVRHVAPLALCFLAGASRSVVQSDPAPGTTPTDRSLKYTLLPTP